MKQTNIHRVPKLATPLASNKLSCLVQFEVHGFQRNIVHCTILALYLLSGASVQVKVNDVDELRQRIQTVWDELDQRIIDKAIKQWRAHLRACVNNNNNNNNTLIYIAPACRMTSEALADSSSRATECLTEK